MQIYLFIFSVVFGTAISITLGPADTNTTEGSTVTCDCIYNGTEDLPLWRINDVLHSSSALPAGYTANKTGLYFQAHEELHLSTYQCLFGFYDDLSDSVEMTESATGTLFVNKGQ